MVALEVQSPIARTWDYVTSEGQNPGRSKAQSHTDPPHFSKLLFLQLLTWSWITVIKMLETRNGSDLCVSPPQVFGIFVHAQCTNIPNICTYTLG